MQQFEKLAVKKISVSNKFFKVVSSVDIFFRFIVSLPEHWVKKK
jgi:hypothetical protein